MKLIHKSILLSLVTLVLLVLLLVFARDNQRTELRLSYENQLYVEVQNVQQQIDRALSAPYALATMLRLNSLNETNFDAIAADMIENYGSIDNLQLAPDGVVSRVYPLQGNEAIIGHNLLGDQGRRTEAQQAIKERGMVLAGPFDLIQGGRAVVGRLPVFLNEGKGEQFWGFTTALIHMASLRAHLRPLERQGYQYQFSRRHPDSGERVYFLKSGSATLDGAMEYDITVPGGEWKMHVLLPSGKGGDAWFMLGLLLSMLGAGLLSFAYYSYRSSQMQKEALELQLLHSQRLNSLGTLAGGIAHEFNNILCSIKGYSELALQKIGPDGNVKKDLQVILDSSLRASVLVNQILTFSRRGENQMVATDLNAVVSEALDIARATIPANIPIKVELEQGVKQVLADEDQIHQVVLNLLNNAHHAVKDGGDILVELKSSSGGVQLSVADTGMGMPKQVREHIFDPFFTTKKVGEGTGLGLSVVHGIIESHRSTINIDSTEGVGTNILILFPVIRQAA